MLRYVNSEEKRKKSLVSFSGGLPFYSGKPKQNFPGFSAAHQPISFHLFLSSFELLFHLHLMTADPNTESSENMATPPTDPTKNHRMKEE